MRYYVYSCFNGSGDYYDLNATFMLFWDAEEYMTRLIDEYSDYTFYTFTMIDTFVVSD